MPAAFVIPAVIAAGAQITSTVLANRAQGKATDKAVRASGVANAEALAFEREQEEARRREFDEAQAENKRQYDLALQRERQTWLEDVAERRRGETRTVEMWNADQVRKQPYRDVSWSAVQSLAKQSGLTVVRTAPPQLTAPPPAPSLADLPGYEFSPSRTL